MRASMEQPEPIRVAVVDDHPLYRQGVVSTIDVCGDMEVVAQGASAAEAVAIAGRELPDIILLDITMPGTGLKAAADISKICPFTKIVMLTVSEDEDDILEAFRAGARGYILKGVSAEELTGILRAVHQGDVYVTPALASQVLITMADGGTGKAASIVDSLSDREKQILERVASGDSNKEVAYDLNLSEKTIKHYMTNIMQKLHVRNRVEAALLASKAGIGKLNRDTSNK